MNQPFPLADQQKLLPPTPLTQIESESAVLMPSPAVLVQSVAHLPHRRDRLFRHGDLALFTPQLDTALTVLVFVDAATAVVLETDHTVQRVFLTVMGSADGTRLTTVATEERSIGNAVLTMPGTERVATVATDGPMLGTEGLITLLAR